jgi:hypothetical protein
MPLIDFTRELRRMESQPHPNTLANQVHMAVNAINAPAPAVPAPAPAASAPCPS